MKTITKQLLIIIGLLVAIVISVTAQDFQGVAIYQSSRKMEGKFSVNGNTANPEMQRQIEEQLKKQFQKEYELKFNPTESNWKEVESLDGGPQTASGGTMVMVRIGSSDGVTYKNTAENSYLKETELFGKPFLVNDKLISSEWKITGESKMIGNYQAQQAIYTEIKERKVFTFSNEKSEEGESDLEVKMDTIKIEAWFTPQVPVSHGPADYWGLPGLILEISDGTTQYVCTKITINPEEKIKIQKPTKGKEVTRDELQAEMDAKTAEMAEKFKQERSNGKKMHIKIKQ